jgi:Cu(I)/Ag(I) efflux system membrane fusion protein
MKATIKTVFVLIIGMGLGYLGTQFIKPKAEKKERKILYWVAPMDQNYRRDKPGKSPMGMDLVPVYADSQGGNNVGHQHGMKINPTVQNNISVKVAKAELRTLSQKIETVGYVTADENTIDKVNSYVDGWVRNLKVSSDGETVKKGELLFELYSPTLISAQEEYLLALKNNPSLIGPSQKKLKTLGMSDGQIKSLKAEMKAQKTLKVYADVSGIVSHLSIRDGAYIKPAKTLLMITDLSHIWVDAEVYDKDVALVKIGQKGMATFGAYPNKEWLGELTFVYPELNAKTRTLKVRLEFPNPDLLLKPNMFADINIYARPIKSTLAIPTSAVIQNNNMEYVIVKDNEDNFYAQEVITGQQMNNWVQIKRGLKKGQSIVVSSQFLIDSESNVQQSLMRISKAKKASKVSREIIGSGKILAIDKKTKAVTLDHEPIPTINMPSMVMKFPIDTDVSLESLKFGDKVTFMLRKNKEGNYVICHINEQKGVKHD